MQEAILFLETDGAPKNPRLTKSLPLWAIAWYLRSKAKDALSQLFRTQARKFPIEPKSHDAVS